MSINFHELRQRFKHYRQRKPFCSCSFCEERQSEHAANITGWWAIAVILGIVLLMCLGPCTPAQAQEIDFDRLVKAIYLAEGGAKTKHPYGILPSYRHTSPKQACYNTIRHQYRLWLSKGRHGTFLASLASVYAPIGATNDPRGLNRNWLANVQRLYDQAH